MHAPQIIGKHLANLQRQYAAMSSYASGHAGPAIRSAIHTLEDWRDNARPGDSDAHAAAMALCEAAERIRASNRLTFHKLIDHPWPACIDVMSSCFRSAHGLAPGILDDGQKGIAGIEPAACVEGE